MAAIKGINVDAIFKLGSTSSVWGTAEEAGAGDRIQGSISDATSSSTREKNPIGQGGIMQSDQEIGQIIPLVSFQGDVGYQNGADKIVAQFMGAATSPAEQTVGQGDYLHRLTLYASANRVLASFAWDMTSADTVEFPSAVVTSITTSVEAAEQYFKIDAEILGNAWESNSSVNDSAAVAAATIANSELCAVKQSDAFWIDTMESGSLASGDQVDIISYSRTLTRPQEMLPSIRGSAGNDTPTETDLISGTLTVTLQELADMTWLDAWENGTEYKCLLNIEGTQIGSGVNKTWNEYTPRMKLIQKPEYNITEAGFNQVTLVFAILEASANPTGMNSKYPYFDIINGRSTTYIS